MPPEIPLETSMDAALEETAPYPSLLALPPEDPPALREARAALPTEGARAEDPEPRIALGLALAGAGCGWEAARLLRPLRKAWNDRPGAEDGRAALEAVAWWNREGGNVARARQEGRLDEVLARSADAAPSLWDHPPLLSHLAEVARRRAVWPPAERLWARIGYLVERGVPGLPSAAFAYFARAGVLEAQAHTGDPAAAFAALDALDYHTGNAMHYRMRHGELALLAGEEEIAMRDAARALLDAERRSGYGRELRLRWVDEAEPLAPLRDRTDWAAMRADPAAWLRETGA